MHLLKLRYDGVLRITEIDAPRFEVLVKAVETAYGIDNIEHYKFTYLDSDGDQVSFDTDAELELALRTTPAPLRISVSAKSPLSSASAVSESKNAPSPFADGADMEDIIMVEMPHDADVDAEGPNQEVHGQNRKRQATTIDPLKAFETEAAAARDPERSKLYQRATQRLAKRYGVHLTPTKLWRVMTLFQMQGRSLVLKGLAPQKLLRAQLSPSAGDSSGEDDSSVMSAVAKAHTAAEPGGMTKGKSSDPRSVATRPVHRLLELNGINLPEDEVPSLLDALRVRPQHLLKPGLLDPVTVDRLRDVIGSGGACQIGRTSRLGGDRGSGRGLRGGRGRTNLSGKHIYFPPPHPLSQHMPPPSFMGDHPRPGQSSSPHTGCDPPLPGDLPPRGMPEGNISSDGPSWWSPPPHHHHAHDHSHPPGAEARGHARRGRGFPQAMNGPRMALNMRGGPGRGRGKGPHPGRGKDAIAMARFVEHRSPAMGSDVARVAPGAHFKKSWLVRNDSMRTWPEECALVPVSRSCEDLSSPPEAPVVGGVAPGEETEVAVDLVAPSQLGMYDGYWRTASVEGPKFGQRLWAKIHVIIPGSEGSHEMDAAVQKLSLADGNKGN